MLLTRARALASANKQIVIHGHAIPLDVIAAIIEFLDFKALKMTSLACRWFRHACFRQLFRSCNIETFAASSAENTRVLHAGINFIQVHGCTSNMKHLSLRFELFRKGTKGPFCRLITGLLDSLNTLNALEEVDLELSLAGDQEIILGELLATRHAFAPCLRKLNSDVNIRLWGPFLNSHPLINSLYLPEISLISDIPQTSLSHLEPFHVASLPHLERLYVRGPISASLLPIAAARQVFVSIVANLHPVAEIIPHISNASTPIHSLSLMPVFASEDDLTAVLDAVAERNDPIGFLDICFINWGEHELHDRHRFYDVIHQYLPRFSMITRLVWMHLPKCAVGHLFEAIKNLELLEQVVIRENDCDDDDDGDDVDVYEVYKKSEGQWKCVKTSSILDWTESLTADECRFRQGAYF